MSSFAGRLAYKPVGIVLGIAAGAVSGIVFKQIWKRIGPETDVPHATDEERRWGEILAAAAIQGAVFAAIRAAVDRAGATGVRSLTGHWPA